MQVARRDIETNRRDLEATRREFETQLAAVEPRTKQGGGGNAGTTADRVKPPKWISCEKAAHLLAVLQGKAVNVLHTAPAGAIYEDIDGALMGRYGDHQLTAAYRVQLKVRTKLIFESLQEFAAAVKQLAHRALLGQPVDFIDREAVLAFADGVREREVKQHLMGGYRSLNEALNQAS
jgi:hypothetical protein